MARESNEEWREFYTEAGFRHGFELGARALRTAMEKHLSPDQRSKLDAWLSDEVATWKTKYLSEEEPPTPPDL